MQSSDAHCLQFDLLEMHATELLLDQVVAAAVRQNQYGQLREPTAWLQLPAEGLHETSVLTRCRLRQTLLKQIQFDLLEVHATELLLD